MAIPAGLHLQPLSPCSTCSVSDETSAMPSNAMDDEASEATARDLVVDQLRAAVSRRAPTSACRQHVQVATIGAATM